MLENMKNYENEEWVDIKGYEGRYQISNYGRIWSIVSQRYLKAHELVGKHYMVVCLIAKNGKKKTEYVHRLVLLSFVGNPPEGKPQCNHKDEDPHNNRLDNLEWVSASENINYGTRNERMAATNSKKVNYYDEDGNLIAVFDSVKAAAQTLKLSNGYVSMICSGSRKGQALGGKKLAYAAD